MVEKRFGGGGANTFWNCFSIMLTLFALRGSTISTIRPLPPLRFPPPSSSSCSPSPPALFFFFFFLSSMVNKSFKASCSSELTCTGAFLFNSEPAAANTLRAAVAASRGSQCTGLNCSLLCCAKRANAAAAFDPFAAFLPFSSPWGFWSPPWRWRLFFPPLLFERAPFLSSAPPVRNKETVSAEKPSATILSATASR